jgi:hypothetical protein
MLLLCYGAVVLCCYFNPLRKHMKEKLKLKRTEGEGNKPYGGDLNMNLCLIFRTGLVHIENTHAHTLYTYTRTLFWARQNQNWSPPSFTKGKGSPAAALRGVKSFVTCI